MDEQQLVQRPGGAEISGNGRENECFFIAFAELY
jgi:hypothetical protein